MHFVAPSMSVKVSAVSGLTLMASQMVSHAALAAALPQVSGALGFVGLALGTFAIGRYWGQMQAHLEVKADNDAAITDLSIATMEFDVRGELRKCTQASQKLLDAQAYELENDGLKNRIHVQDVPEFLTKISAVAHSDKPASTTVRVMIGEQSSEIRQPYTLIKFDFFPNSNTTVVATVGLENAPGQLQSELLHAHEILDAAELARTNFLASVSHELRTPLNAIIGFSELLDANINGELSDPQREYVSHIHQSGTHLLGVVNTLLEMSRIDAGQVELYLSQIAPGDVITSVFNMLALEAGEKNIELVADLPPALPLLTGDERAYTQIFINLVSNAIKFSGKDTKIIVRARRVRDSLLIEVSDQGIGIARDALEQLGTPFYQVQSSASRSYEGTGLGLSIVKGLVKLHQGEFSILSTRGQGTQVSVTLPLDGPKAGLTSAKIKEISAAPHGAHQNDRQLRHARG